MTFLLLLLALQDARCRRGRAPPGSRGAGREGARDLIPALLPLLEDPEERMRGGAALSLAERGRADAGPKEARRAAGQGCLRDPEDCRPRLRAAHRALGYGDPALRHLRCFPSPDRARKN